MFFEPFKCADCGSTYYRALSGNVCRGCGDILLDRDLTLEWGEVRTMTVDETAGYTHKSDCGDCLAGVTGWHGYFPADEEMSA